MFFDFYVHDPYYDRREVLVESTRCASRVNDIFVVNKSFEYERTTTELAVYQYDVTL